MRNSPEERSYHLLRGGGLKSLKYFCVCFGGPFTGVTFVFQKLFLCCLLESKCLNSACCTLVILESEVGCRRKIIVVLHLRYSLIAQERIKYVVVQLPRTDIFFISLYCTTSLIITDYKYTYVTY